ncbi:hypothetical protein B0H17DRAFT_1212353 [Mycena rosella]|uniref:Uncharacterized protein n=1 Tax=Mycena rosella TaxID=1033263 RepID=A0AAD7CSS4_MYCRO|nr:hypothetical protein B0H17DRAFT_1212353 [Mycena rosella]
MSLGALFSTVSISARSLVLGRGKWTWSAMSISIIIFTGIQTSGWSTFITPVRIVVETSVSGSELDLASPGLRQMQSSGALDACIYNSTRASFTVMDNTFNVSTAGVLPATLRDVNATAWFYGSTNVPTLTMVPSIMQDIDELPDGLSFNYSMVQQGFSVDVICAPQALNADTTPSLTVNFDTVTQWARRNISLVDTITYTELTSNCPIPDGSLFNFTYAYTAREPTNYILMIACGPADNYTLIFESAGRYQQPTTVCTLSPKITRVNVDYSDPKSGVGIISPMTVSDGAVRDPEGPGGLSAVATMHNMIFVAQGAGTNDIGNEMNSLLTEVDANDFEEARLALMEQYIRGVAEYSGSMLRTCLSGNKEVFAHGVPLDMTIPTSGIIFTYTVGWTHYEASSTWVLIPGTVVALATIIIVVVAVAQHAGDPPSDVFDPANGMHLVAAAAAGGLHDAFTGTSNKDIETGERIRVVLGSIPGRGPALIRMDAEDMTRQFT